MACRRLLSSPSVGAAVSSKFLPGSAARGKNGPLLASLLFYKHPTLIGGALFLLMLSGPPRLRIRDAEASLRGGMDWVVVLGMGYYSASRIHGLEYNPGLGTAHSMIIEVLSGGGVLSFASLIALCAALSMYAAALFYAKGNRLSFGTCSLVFASLLFGSMGEEIDSGPVAVGFWYCVAVLPRLYEQYVKPSPVPVEPDKCLPMTLGAVTDPEAS